MLPEHSTSFLWFILVVFPPPISWHLKARVIDLSVFLQIQIMQRELKLCQKSLKEDSKEIDMDNSSLLYCEYLHLFASGLRDFIER